MNKKTTQEKEATLPQVIDKNSLHWKDPATIFLVLVFVLCIIILIASKL